MKQSPVAPIQEQQLFADILATKDDPYSFVMYAFPWGEPNTPLHNQQGPREWQKEILDEITQHIKACRRNRVNNNPLQVLRTSTVSGRGIGKSAIVAWLILWMMSTKLGSTTIVAANNEQQLTTRTWPEMGKWHTMSINSHWFEKTATALKPQEWFDQILTTQQKIDTGYYYARAQLWTEENADAFAGAHNHHGIQVLFDEASGIPAPIWKVTEGFFTEPIDDRYWHVFSNGRRNTGAFFETHHRNRDFWNRRQIDSRTVEGLDPEVFASIIRQYDEDSDEARVEIYGQFPNTGDNQFISRSVVMDATQRPTTLDHGAPLTMGVDVARFGDDRSVILLRRGRHLVSFNRYSSFDTTQVAARAVEFIDKHKPDAIFVDGGGVGGGVVDQLKQMHYNPVEVQSGSSPSDKVKYANKRVEMWGDMREWLQTASIPNDELLIDDLLGPEYEFSLNGQLKLEAKEHMKKRHLASPDIADALALTFAKNVGRSDTPSSRRRPTMAKGMDYDLFG